MRSLKLAASTLFALIFLASLSFAQQSWKTFKPAGAIFSVSMPGTPTPQSQSLSDPAAGKIDMKIYTLYSGEYFYVAQDVKVAKMVGGSSKILKDFEVGFLSTSGTTLVSAQETKFKGYTARTMLFKKDAKRVRAIAVIVGNQVLGFFATADESKMKSTPVTKFFNSIKINGK